MGPGRDDPVVGVSLKLKDRMPCSFVPMNRCDCPTDIDEARVIAYLPWCSARDRLLVILGLQTGLRLSELLRLTVSSVWQQGAPVSVIRVQRKALKGGRSTRARTVRGRVIPLNAQAQGAVATYILEREEADGLPPGAPLFPSRKGDRALQRAQAWVIVRAIFRNAGLDHSRIWGGHSLRRRFCRRVYDETGSIEITRVAVGHRWVQTTQQYLGFEEEDAAAAILAIGRTAAPPKQEFRAELGTDGVPIWHAQGDSR
jgi:integrase